MGLFSISFSYYVDESSRSGYVKVNDIDNEIQSSALTNGEITVGANETVDFNLFVISNNNFDSKFELYYQTAALDNVNIYTVDDIDEIIPSHSVYKYKIVIENYNNESINVSLGVASATLNDDINLPGNRIEKEKTDD
jgi:hypothetical protein